MSDPHRLPTKPEEWGLRQDIAALGRIASAVLASHDDMREIKESLDSIRDAIYDLSSAIRERRGP
jgi:hypothetical protein